MYPTARGSPGQPQPLAVVPRLIAKPLPLLDAMPAFQNATRMPPLAVPVRLWSDIAMPSTAPNSVDVLGGVVVEAGTEHGAHRAALAGCCEGKTLPDQHRVDGGIANVPPRNHAAMHAGLQGMVAAEEGSSSSTLRTGRAPRSSAAC